MVKVEGEGFSEMIDSIDTLELEYAIFGNTLFLSDGRTIQKYKRNYIFCNNLIKLDVAKTIYWEVL